MGGESTSAGLGQPHQMLQLEIMVQFRPLVGRERIVLFTLDQLGDPPSRRFRRTKRRHAVRVAPGGDEIDHFFISSRGNGHDIELHLQAVGLPPFNSILRGRELPDHENRPDKHHNGAALRLTHPTISMPRPLRRDRRPWRESGGWCPIARGSSCRECRSIGR